ncbi:hypothetical protein RRF57_007490 [Xylaria bambusicola]|uniref:Uncharacterized protein n=1 Tax=Xylaria bambusicola TaxID=326684 RepID=A0AAN7ZAG4_9PEZI
MNTEEIVPRFGTAAPFHFYALPAEVRLQILEHTDLITPTREVRWDPVTGYKVPPSRRTRPGPDAWRTPRALFLVSKAFHADAREIFFKNNRIVVWHHISVVGVGPSPPASLSLLDDYAATMYFTNVLTAESFRHLRHLELLMFISIHSSTAMTMKMGVAERHNIARENWFRVLRHIYSSDNAALDNLRVLRVSGFYDGYLRHVHDVAAAGNTTQGAQFNALRNFVKTYVWPMIEPEHGPPQLPRQLIVEIQGPSMSISRYCIRKKGEKVYNENTGLLFGSPNATRLISWKPLNPGNGVEEAWVDETREVEWIEEVWMKQVGSGMKNGSGSQQLWVAGSVPLAHLDALVRIISRDLS